MNTLSLLLSGTFFLAQAFAGTFSGHQPASRTSDGRLHIEYEVCKQAKALTGGAQANCLIQLSGQQSDHRVYLVQTSRFNTQSNKIELKYYLAMSDNNDYANGIRSINEVQESQLKTLLGTDSNTPDRIRVTPGLIESAD